MRVGVVTDSAANLPGELVDQHRITVVPMTLKFGDRVYLDGIDIPKGTFYPQLVEQKVPVSTSAPSIGDFTSAYERALSSADAAVCVVVASFLSATFDAASAAARAFEGRIVVVDSRSASLGEGFSALEAARAADAGEDLESVAARAREVAGRTTLVATINTFEFLRRSGRVNVVLAYAGTALNIKPVFGFRHGKLEQLGRPRTRSAAIGKLVDEARAAAAHGPLHLGVVHADCADEAQGLLDRITAELPAAESIISEFTPLMGSHTGPGLLGVAFWV
jgi:DegV family protein with EDD domain